MSWICSIKVLAIFTKQKTSAQSWRHTPYLFHQITNQHQHYKKHPKSKLKHLGEYCIWINGEWVGIMTNAASSHQGGICLFCFVCLSVFWLYVPGHVKHCLTRSKMTSWTLVVFFCLHFRDLMLLWGQSLLQCIDSAQWLQMGWELQRA